MSTLTIRNKSSRISLTGIAKFGAVHLPIWGRVHFKIYSSQTLSFKNAKPRRNESSISTYKTHSSDLCNPCTTFCIVGRSAAVVLQHSCRMGQMTFSPQIGGSGRAGLTPFIMLSMIDSGLRPEYGFSPAQICTPASQ